MWNKSLNVCDRKIATEKWFEVMQWKVVLTSVGIMQQCDNSCVINWEEKGSERT